MLNNNNRKSIKIFIPCLLWQESPPGAWYMTSSTQQKTQPAWSYKGRLFQVPSQVPSPWCPYYPDDDRDAVSSESTMASKLSYVGSFLRLPIPLPSLGTLGWQSSGERWGDSSKAPSPLWVCNPLESVLNPTREQLLSLQQSWRYWTSGYF